MDLRNASFVLLVLYSACVRLTRDRPVDLLLDGGDRPVER